MIFCPLRLLLLAGLVCLGATVARAQPVDYAREVWPILRERCAQCHGGMVQKGKLNLLDPASAAKALRAEPGGVVPLLQRVHSREAEEQMPPRGERLTAGQVATLERWVAQGAPQSEHWAYVAPQAPMAGATLDSVVGARLRERGLAFAPAAEPETLLRRVTLDLTGLPPTLAEAEAFLRDPSPAAYAQVVERLLASPAFGEHWATQWLDVARYADSQGYEKDNLRITWAYRDWVIQALNADLPFDQFTIEQLAGDLLPNATEDQLTATAFHRQTMTNTEGGTDDEEFRLKAVVERTNTTATAWLGLTLECAQCHDHPYEPLTQRDYFRFLAFFNNTVDADRDDDAPMRTLLPQSQRARAATLRAELAGELPPARRAELEAQLRGLPETMVPVLQERSAAEARETQRWQRGSWLAPAERVWPGVPALFRTQLTGGGLNRLDLARWIASAENPLTARVAVNRIWAQLFGRGLVETAGDFGRTGALPKQQAALDLLAYRFSHELRWSVKALLREIVLSRVYQQSSRISPEALATDPENRWLARGPRVRLTAEMIRDQALAVSGLLTQKLYGPSVMPPQPEGVWQVVYNVQRWRPSRGEDRYRRALYTFRRRASPHPALLALDAPSREGCTVQRTVSNTPAAALALLNDPLMHEAAAALGGRMVAEGGATLAERLRQGWRRVLTTPPTETALARLEKLWAEARQETTVEADAYTAVALALLNLDATLTKE